MTALAAQRSTPVMAGGPNPENLSFPIADNVKVYKGSLVMLDGGYLKPGATATGKVAVGQAEETVDNTGTGHTAGRFNVPVKQGVFKFANSASSDAIAQAEVGSSCYLVDDQTVAKTDGSNSRSVAGKVIQVDTDGVWVKVGF